MRKKFSRENYPALNYYWDPRTYQEWAIYLAVWTPFFLVEWLAHTQGWVSWVLSFFGIFTGLTLMKPIRKRIWH
jgi:hypothetical protein